jgi:hypothetical protein
LVTTEAIDVEVCCGVTSDSHEIGDPLLPNVPSTAPVDARRTSK